LREVDAIEAGSPEHKAALAEDRRVRVRTMREDPMRETEPALARVRSVVDIYEPGSTFKPFVWASLVERGAVRVDEAFDTEGGVWVTEYGRRLEDEAPRDEQTWADVLVHSSNIGMAKGAARVSFGDLRDDVLRWGFGRSTGVGIPGEARGLVTRARDWTDLSQSSVPMGYEVGVTPLQMARAFSVFARSGNRAGEMPGLSLEALRTGDPRLRVTERLLRPSVAEAGRDAMVEVAEKMATRTPLWIPGEERFAYTAFGKSGTAKMVSPAGGYLERQYTSSFVAGVPAERPRIVLVVIIDDPGPEVVRKGRYFGSMTAGPALLRIASRAMGYLGVTPDRVDEDEVAER
ncbi:MAG: penicillin-binding transpeptidase domain-containing protein, partial [Planctomycetota bacterium]